MQLLKSEFEGIVCMTMEGAEFEEMYVRYEDFKGDYKEYDLLFVAYDSANRNLHFVNLTRFSSASGMPTSDLIELLLTVRPGKTPSVNRK